MHGALIQTKIRHKPADHFSGRVFDALIERTGIANRKNMRLIFTPGPVDGFALVQMNRKTDIKRNFNTRTHNFTIALKRVSIANVKKRALDKNRQINRRALVETLVIHIPTVRG